MVIFNSYVNVYQRVVHMLHYQLRKNGLGTVSLAVPGGLLITGIELQPRAVAAEREEKAAAAEVQVK